MDAARCDVLTAMLLGVEVLWDATVCCVVLCCVGCAVTDDS
jgi:hypothetical protein